MTNLTEHAKTILRAIADEKKLEKQYPDSPTWHSVSHDEVLIDLGQARRVTHRIAPETRSINGVVFAAPVGEEGRWCFAPSQAARLMEYFWTDPEDRGTAFNAIIDALEGKTK